jgi:membrane protease subunit HflC
MAIPRTPIFVFGAFFLMMTVSETAFIVDETKQAIVLQFGSPQRTIRNAGLYFKVPFIQNAVLFDRRVLEVDPEPERVLLASTNDAIMSRLMPKQAEGEEAVPQDYDDSGSPIIVDTFARWRITDPLKFRQRLSSETAARQRIENEMDSTTRDVLGKSTLEKLLSADRVHLMERIKKRVNTSMSGLGIEIVDVRINRADLTANIKDATFSRMRSEREQRAAEIRSMGEKRALEIRSDADKERTVLLAEAKRQGQILRGKGDESATRIYADAYKRDPEFYSFYRSLDVYKATLGRKETTLILSPDSAFFKTLKEAP